jgi:hypothetical protein
MKKTQSRLEFVVKNNGRRFFALFTTLVTVVATLAGCYTEVSMSDAVGTYVREPRRGQALDVFIVDFNNEYRYVHIAQTGNTYTKQGVWGAHHSKNGQVSSVSFNDHVAYEENIGGKKGTVILAVEADIKSVRLCFGPSYEPGHFCYVKPR